MMDMGEGYSVEYIAFYIAKLPDGDLKLESMQTSREIDQFFIDLNSAMANKSNAFWVTSDLVIENTGHYNFKFSYDPPKRLNCVFDEGSLWRFNRYLETYKAERQSREP